MLVIFGLAAGFFSSRLPTSFLPDEDQGYFYVNLQLPNASSLQRTEEVATKVEKIIENTPGVKYATSVIGISLLSLVRTSYNAFIFVNMDEWKDRKSRAKQFQVMKQHINQELEQDSGRNRVRLFATRYSGSGHCRRIHVCIGGSRREGCAVPFDEPKHVYDRGAETP